jgi:hypothetical protein
MGRKLESQFVHDVFEPELKRRFPGGYFLKQDAGMRQGIPDRLFLWEDKWASFETKRGAKEANQPNQPFYVEKMNEMSFAAFVNPDNYEEVLDDLECAWKGVCK